MIFITGSKSFIGVNLIKKLEQDKIKYIGIDSKKLKNTKKHKTKDICDPNLFKVIPKNSTVIHLAAISNVKECKINPKKTLRTNLSGTINLINQSIKKNVKHFIFASTEWVYPNRNEILKENSKINPNLLDNEYALSKYIGEQILLTFNKQIKITILRFGIIYSDRNNGGSAIESLVKSVKGNNIVKIGSKNTSRRFVHVDDIINGIMLSYNKQLNGIFNLAGNEDINLKKIITIAEKILNKKVKIIQESNSKASIRKISNNKAKKILGWYPKIGIKAGINKILC